MTPNRCTKHEPRDDEFWDSPANERRRAESRACWRCKALALYAYAVWRWRVFTGEEPN